METMLCRPNRLDLKTSHRSGLNLGLRLIRKRPDPYGALAPMPTGDFRGPRGLPSPAPVRPRGLSVASWVWFWVPVSLAGTTLSRLLGGLLLVAWPARALEFIHGEGHTPVDTPLGHTVFVVQLFVDARASVVAQLALVVVSDAHTAAYGRRNVGPSASTVTGPHHLSPAMCR